jgi:hypothetical protein
MIIREQSGCPIFPPAFGHFGRAFMNEKRCKRMFAVYSFRGPV